MKGFTAWLVQDRRTADNPLSHLYGGNVKLDRRHDRRALSLVELRATLNTAAGSNVLFRGLSGRDRHVLYLTACATGFRAEELACLRPESFALDAEPPVAVLGAAETKNRKGAIQPLPLDVAAALRDYLEGRPVGVPLWPGTWWKRGADMLRIDLDGAGVPLQPKERASNGRVREAQEAPDLAQRLPLAGGGRGSPVAWPAVSGPGLWSGRAFSGSNRFLGPGMSGVGCSQWNRAPARFSPDTRGYAYFPRWQTGPAPFEL
jgi:hypothetical protein